MMHEQLNEEQIAVSLDLEDNLESNKPPFMDTLTLFVRNNHEDDFKEWLEEGEWLQENDGCSEEDFLDEEGRISFHSGLVKNWGFQPFTDIMSYVRDWEGGFGDHIQKFMYGDPLEFEDKRLDAEVQALKDDPDRAYAFEGEPKDEHNSVWPGFQTLMAQYFRGRPEVFPFNDDNAAVYLRDFKEDFPEVTVDVLTSRSDAVNVKEEPDNYQEATDPDVVQGVEDYLLMHGITENLDNSRISWHKKDHDAGFENPDDAERGYKIFADDAPLDHIGLHDHQIQLVYKTSSNNEQEIPEWQEIKEGEYGVGALEEYGFEDSNAFFVNSQRESFQAIRYLTEALTGSERSENNYVEISGV